MGAPVLPEAAKANTKAGAIAFVRHYVELINYAQATGDTATLAGAELADCGSCKNSQKYLKDLYTRGGHIEGGAFRATLLQALPNPAFGDWAVVLSLKFDPETVFEPWETPPSHHLTGGEGLATYFPEFDDGHWLMSEWKRSQ